MNVELKPHAGINVVGKRQEHSYADVLCDGRLVGYAYPQPAESDGVIFNLVRRASEAEIGEAIEAVRAEYAGRKVHVKGPAPWIPRELLAAAEEDDDEDD